MRNRAGIIERSPTGMDEVINSDFIVDERRRECGLGRGK
jgi:hypothetical protein